MSVGDFGDFMKKFLLVFLLSAFSAKAELYYNYKQNIYYCANYGAVQIDQQEYNKLFKDVLRMKIMNKESTYNILYYLYIIGTNTSIQLAKDMKSFVDYMCGGHCNMQNWTDAMNINYVPTTDYR